MRLSRFVSSSALLVAAGCAVASGAAAQNRGWVETAPLAPPAPVGPPGQPPARLQQPRPVQPPPAVAPMQAPAAGPATQTTPEGDEVVVQPPAQRIANPYAVYAGLDKITGRTTTFTVALGETVQFGALQVTPRACYTRPPTEQQNTTSFTEVNEVTLRGEAKRIFTGWMFASSPGLHAVEHPIYDVWLTGCSTSMPGTGKPGGQQ